MSEWFSHFGYAQVADGLLSGAYPLDADDVKRLAAESVEVAYNLCEDAEYAPVQRHAVYQALAEVGIKERRLPMPDHGRLSPESLDRAVDEVMLELEAGRRVYLHCRAGWQRSAAVAAAVIARREEIDLYRALLVFRDRKPASEPLPHQLADLAEWWQNRYPRPTTTTETDPIDRP
jgi:atypical dual specificity phosphatase